MFVGLPNNFTSLTMIRSNLFKSFIFQKQRECAGMISLKTLPEGLHDNLKFEMQDIFFPNFESALNYFTSATRF